MIKEVIFYIDGKKIVAKKYELGELTIIDFGKPGLQMPYVTADGFDPVFNSLDLKKLNSFLERLK